MDIPYWSGTGPYHSITVRMDFSDPNIVGTFVYHCHILEHEDGGMMGEIQVLPPGSAATATVAASASSIAPNQNVTLTANVVGCDYRESDADRPRAVPAERRERRQSGNHHRRSGDADHAGGRKRRRQ